MHCGQTDGVVGRNYCHPQRSSDSPRQTMTSRGCGSAGTPTTSSNGYTGLATVITSNSPFSIRAGAVIFRRYQSTPSFWANHRRVKRPGHSIHQGGWYPDGIRDSEGPVPPLLLSGPSVVTSLPRPPTLGRGYQRRLLNDLPVRWLSGEGASRQPWDEELERCHFLSASESSSEED